jgi:hypothetical protein
VTVCHQTVNQDIQLVSVIALEKFTKYASMYQSLSKSFEFAVDIVLFVVIQTFTLDRILEL